MSIKETIERVTADGGKLDKFLGVAFGVLAVVDLVAGHPLDAGLDLAFALSMARICRLAKQAGVAP